MPFDVGGAAQATTYPRGFSVTTEWRWPLIPARQLVTLNYGKALKANNRIDGPVPVFGTNGQCGWHNAALAKGPGLILGRKGQGPLGVEWCEHDFWVIDTAYYATILSADVDLKYLYHLIKYIGLNHLKDGTSNPTLSRDVFGRQLLPVPSLIEQKAISAVLGLLDDRISVLRKTSTTLEAIAQALFKSWFIDFDPVHAKAEGRELEGMVASTAELFPTEFEESALGPIPKGWSEGVFGDLAELIKGTVNPMNTPNVLFEHYSLPAFDAAQLPEFELGDAIKSNKTRVPAGAVLQSKLNPHIPRVWFPLRAGEGAVCSTEFLPWVAKQIANAEVVYCTLTSPTFEAAVRTLVTGTSNSHQRVKPDQVAGLALVLAPSVVYDEFARVARPLLEKAGENRLMAKSLAELGGTLLPRLMSGKLRLPEAQEQIEEALA